MNIFNEDFQDFIHSLNKCKVEYMLVGGYAVILRGYSRSTGDMDIWVNKTPENYHQLKQAIQEFGLPAEAIPYSQFFSTEYDVFSFGRPPYAIEVMTAVKGLEFNPAFLQSTIEQVDGLPVRVIHLNQLVEAKKAAGRNKDLNDLENLPV
jgi:predicted nucleotidyltransferase